MRGPNRSRFVTFVRNSIVGIRSTLNDEVATLYVIDFIDDVIRITRDEFRRDVVDLADGR